MERRDLRYALLCVAALVTAMGLTNPVAESGLNDDWSYTKTALDLAETGNLVYNGWASAMVGAQAYWGALFIKLFGFSFLTVRLSTAPLALGCCLLTYGLHRRAKLPPALAAFGTLTLCLSPIFIPHAVSFMTDIPALFFFLLSIYGYVRVAEVLDTVAFEPSPKRPWQGRFLGWLSLGLMAGVLGGSVRQVGWLVPMLAPLLLIQRRRALIKVPAAAYPLFGSVAVAFASAILISAWFNQQPYAIHEKLTNGLSALKSPMTLPYLSRQALALTLTLGVLLLPILLILPRLYRKWLAGSPRARAMLLTALLITIALGTSPILAFHDKWYFPFLGGAVDRVPFMTGTAPIAASNMSWILPKSFWQGLSVCVIALVSAAIALWMSAVFWRRSESSEQSHDASVSPVVALLGIFVAVYIPIALFKSVVPDSFGLFDRYLLPVIPLATVGLLGLFHRWTGREKVPALSWVVLGLLAFYGTAQTHDYFAQLQARVALTRYLEQHGIPRTQIMAGFEYDGWTQITVANCYNDSRIENPKGIYSNARKSIGFSTVYDLWSHAPVVRPDYVVGIGRHPELFDTDIGPLEFDCWLPPLRRFLCVQVTEPARVAVSALALQPARDLVQQ